MSSDKRKKLDLLFERDMPTKPSTYDIIQEAWENHEERIIVLENGYLETVEKIEIHDGEIVIIEKRFRSIINTGIASTAGFMIGIYTLLDVGYITFDVGVPLLVGLSAILIGFLDGWRKRK